MEGVELVKIETEVTKEINEVGVAFKSVISNYKKAKADGWQAGQDIPAVLMGSYQELITAIDNLDKAKAEAQEHPVKATLGAVIPIAEGVELLLEKEDEE